MRIIKLLIACTIVFCAAGCKEDNPQPNSREESAVMKSADPVFSLLPASSAYSVPFADSVPPVTSPSSAAPSAPIPEPSTIVLLGAGVVALAARHWKKIPPE